MSQKTAGQKLLEELQNEAQEISKAMADSEITEKAKSAASAVADAVEDAAEDVVDEIVDDSSLLLRKVKEFLPSKENTFKILKFVVYWELLKLVLSKLF